MHTHQAAAQRRYGSRPIAIGRSAGVANEMAMPIPYRAAATANGIIATHKELQSGAVNIQSEYAASNKVTNNTSRAQRGAVARFKCGNAGAAESTQTSSRPTVSRSAV